MSDALEFEPQGVALESQSRNFNSTVMRYGRLLRKNYSSELSATETRSLEGLEAALDVTGQLNLQTAQQIERGMLFVGMPAWQMLASVETLRLAGTATLEEFTIKEYEGRPVREIGRGRVSLETIITCRNDIGLEDEKVISFTTFGRTTFESLNRLASRSNVQTNFRAGDFSDSSPESQKYILLGRVPPREPRVVSVDAGGWPGLILFPVSSSNGNLPETTIGDHIGSSISSGGRPRILQYLRRTCFPGVTSF